MKNTFERCGAFLRLKTFLGLALLAVTQAASAALEFEKTVIEDVVAPGERSFPFEFPFENTGDAAVEISEIKTTCGCTTAKLERWSMRRVSPA